MAAWRVSAQHQVCQGRKVMHFKGLFSIVWRAPRIRDV